MPHGGGIVSQVLGITIISNSLLLWSNQDLMIKDAFHISLSLLQLLTLRFLPAICCIAFLFFSNQFVFSLLQFCDLRKPILAKTVKCLFRFPVAS